MLGQPAHAARSFRRCWWAQTGHRSGCAHAEVFRKPGTTMFLRLIHWFAPAAWAWDTVLADSDRWGARKFTIGPSGSRKRPCIGSFSGSFTSPSPRQPTALQGMPRSHVKSRQLLTRSFPATHQPRKSHASSMHRPHIRHMQPASLTQPCQKPPTHSVTRTAQHSTALDEHHLCCLGRPSLDRCCSPLPCCPCCPACSPRVCRLRVPRWPSRCRGS